ncbi:hypothetical protein ACGFZA_15925 [Streptomyces sp. NPDC048211]|uniref:hypothetical protein n=1 Tax=Streptomyces sp. NPDC048211 TaxID=3365516 RepID=UPI00372292E3
MGLINMELRINPCQDQPGQVELSVHNQAGEKQWRVVIPAEKAYLAAQRLTVCAMAVEDDAT